MLKRLAYYDSRLFVDQLREGDAYQALRPAIMICVLDGRLLRDSSDLHLDFRLRDAAGRILTDDLQIHVLQLTNIGIAREHLPTASPVERRAFFLLNAEKIPPDELRELFPEPEFVEATGVLEVINQTPEKRDKYISRLKYQLDEAARIEYTREESRQLKPFANFYGPK